LLLSISLRPSQQFADLGDGMICDLGEDVVEIELLIEAVELGRAEQRVGGCCGFTTGVRSGEEEVFASEGDDAQRPLGCVVVDLESSMPM
jgi:hypothetical protein